MPQDVAYAIMFDDGTVMEVLLSVAIALLLIAIGFQIYLNHKMNRLRNQGIDIGSSRLESLVKRS